MAKQTILVPDIGDYSDIPVIEVLIKVGDVIEKEQPLLVLESDKATMEVPADAAGTILSIAVKAGDKVSKGSVVAEIEAGAAAEPKPSASTVKVTRMRAAPAAMGGMPRNSKRARLRQSATKSRSPCTTCKANAVCPSW
jgi:dihydrolipoamide dehydrogenase